MTTEKTYISNVVKRTPRARSKRLREASSSVSKTTSVSPSISDEALILLNALFTAHYNEDGSLESIEANADFWTNFGVTAKGQGSGSGGGGGGIDMDSVWDALASIGSNQIDKSHLNEALSGYLTSASLAPVAISGEYDDLTGKPSLKTVATSGSYNDLTNKPALKTVATSGSYTDLTNKPALKAVATSGSYNDLTDKPSLSYLPLAGGTLTGDLTTGANLKVQDTNSGSVGLEFWRGSGGSWKVSVEAAYLYFRSNWNGSKGDYFDVVKMSPTTGNIEISKGALSVAGAVTLFGSTKAKRRVYFGDVDHYIELDDNGRFHFSHDLYGDGSITAKGVGSGGGGGGIDMDSVWDALASIGSNQIDKSHLATALSQYSKTAALATVATSGSYNDLTGKPELSFLPLEGGTLTGDLTIAKGKKIKFGNGYITEAENGNTYFSDGTNSILVFDSANNAVRKGNTNTSATLGTSDKPWASVYATTLYESGSTLAETYLALTGGTLSGNLTLPRVNIKSGDDTLMYLTSTSGNPYFGDGSKTYLVFDKTNFAVRRGTSTGSAVMTLGTSDYPWASVYATSVYEAGKTLSETYLALSGGTLTGDLTMTQGKKLKFGSGYLTQSASTSNVFYNDGTRTMLVLDSTNNGLRQVSGGSTTLGTAAVPWANVYTSSLRVQSADTTAGGDVTLEMWRGSSGSWQFKDSAANLFIQSNWTGSKGDYFDVMKLSHTTGNVLISKGELTVNGDVTCLTSTSDMRLKTNVHEYDIDLDKIADLPIIEYDRTDVDAHLVGTSAQRMQEVLPDLVHEREDGYLALREGQIGMVLSINASKEIRKLRDEVADLKAEIEELKSIIRGR